MSYYFWLGADAEFECPPNEINYAMRRIMAELRSKIEDDGFITVHPMVKR
jgi:hypothetical protein